MKTIVFDDLISGKDSLSVIGLGYVGLPIAAAFASKLPVIAFDINKEKIENYKSGIDPTKEIGDEAIAHTSAQFTSDANDLKKARFHIVAVPTPVLSDKSPDLRHLRSVCRILGENLTEGSVVVFESTVYPGVTEEVCAPLLEQYSKMVCGVGFKVGYSPERISPADKVHRLESIVKVVSGMDTETLDLVASVYSLIINAGIYRANSIMVAEAAKVIENSQRDINIAFMNELSIIFHRLGIDTREVLAAASTKWNFLPFTPGLVGGHCIGVDPYYLTYRAEQYGYHSQIILSGRRINDDMSKYVAENTVKQMIKMDIPVHKARVGILGITFKEDCPDPRNTKVVDIIRELQEYGAKCIVCDPVADDHDVNALYGLDLVPLAQIKNLDCLIIAVSHKQFLSLSRADIDSMYAAERSCKVLIDVKGIFDQNEYNKPSYVYWRL